MCGGHFGICLKVVFPLKYTCAVCGTTLNICLLEALIHILVRCSLSCKSGDKIYILLERKCVYISKSMLVICKYLPTCSEKNKTILRHSINIVGNNKKEELWKKMIRMHIYLVSRKKILFFLITQ